MTQKRALDTQPKTHRSSADYEHIEWLEFGEITFVCFGARFFVVLFPQLTSLPVIGALAYARIHEMRALVAVLVHALLVDTNRLAHLLKLAAYRLGRVRRQELVEQLLKRRTTRWRLLLWLLLLMSMD